MIDYLKSELELNENELPKAILKGYQMPCKWHGLTFRPTERFIHFATESSLKRVGLSGVRIGITNGLTAKIIIQNSPHKIMNSGFNHGDFSQSQLVDYITKVSERLGIPYWDAKLKGRIEFAVNLKESNPQSFISDLDTHKAKLFEPMKHKGKVYGKRSQVLALRPKIYSPWFKEKLSDFTIPKFDDTILRCEVVSSISYLNKRPSINIQTVKDLTNPTLMESIGVLLSNSMKPITFKGSMTDVNLKDETVFYFIRFAPKERLDRFRLEQPKTYKRYMKRYRDVLNGLSIQENNLPSRVLNKWNLLSSS